MKALVLFLGILFFFSCGKEVETIHPVQQTITESVYASGTVESKNQYTAYASASGLVTHIFRTEGESVFAGEPVLAIASVAQQLNKENAALNATFSDISANQGKLREASERVDLARFKLQNDSLQFDRQKQLFDRNLNAKIDLEQATLLYQNSKASFVSARVNYADLKRQLELSSKQAKNNLRIVKSSANDYTLKSMLAGEVYALNVAVGELVTPQTPVAILGAKNEYVLKMQVDEYDIERIEMGQKVVVVLNSNKTDIYKAEVTKIYPLMNTATRTFLVEAEFTKRPKQLYPNVSFEANIVIQTKQKAILVPRAYVSEDNRVTLKNGEKVTVKTGLKDYKMIEITTGIKKTDELVKLTE